MSETSQQHLAVAGGGLMGSGIAAQLAAHGQPVVVFESQPAAAAQVAGRCHGVFDELVRGGALADAGAAMDRVTVTTCPEDLAGADVIVEAVSESLAAKHALYATLEAVVAPDALLASSTSGFLPDALAAPLRHPERFLVAHFWNPPHLVPLVEVVGGTATRRDVIDRMVHTLAGVGCQPVKLDKAVPGFVGNRLQFALLREALHLLDDGVADAATIDLIVTQTIGKRYALIGPLAGADLGGLGTFHAIATYLMPLLSRDDQAVRVLASQVAAGRLGRSSGEGFHAWTPEREAGLARVRQALLQRTHRPDAG